MPESGRVDAQGTGVRAQGGSDSTPPTLEEVAALAGVSRSTVSRVVNNSPHVTMAVVEAVNNAIAALRYSPNRAARALVSRRTQVVALIFPESAGRVFADPFFAAVTQGIAQRLSDTDYTLNLLFSSESDADKTRRYLTSGSVDGALVVSHHTGDHSYADLESLPIVFGGRPLVQRALPTYFVDSDNVGGAAAAVDRLHAVGRDRIAIIAGPEDMPPGRDRLQGALTRAEQHSMTVVRVERADFSAAAGTAAAQRLVACGLPFDGVFAASDQMAAAAVTELVALGLRVPDDVAVIGFDDDVFARTCVPALTTLRQDPYALGSTMASMLLELLDGGEPRHEVILPTRLVVRGSA